MWLFCIGNINAMCCNNEQSTTKTESSRPFSYNIWEKTKAIIYHWSILVHHIVSILFLGIHSHHTQVTLVKQVLHDVRSMHVISTKIMTCRDKL